MKPGIIVMAELRGAVGERMRAIQQAYDPRMAAELPPHITITGSSGMGPFPPSTTDDELDAALQPVATGIEPFSVTLLPPERFMQSTVVVMPINPNGPIRELHERIKASGLPFEQARFTFTPHATLSYYPELSRARLYDLLSQRIAEPILVDSIQAYRAVDMTRTMCVLDLALGGTSVT